MVKLTKGESIAIGAAGAATAAFLIINGAVAHEKATDHARIARNEKTIAQVSRILNHVVYLKDGVNIRTSMAFNEPGKTRDGVNPGNIDATVGAGKYAHKTVVVTRPGIQTDKDGTQWIVFDAPNTGDNKNVQDKAAHLNYVAIGEVALQSPESIVVGPVKDDLGQGEFIPAEFNEGQSDFQTRTGNHQTIPYALTATTIPANGK